VTVEENTIDTIIHVRKMVKIHPAGVML
jgi:hypothetical protein